MAQLDDAVPDVLARPVATTSAGLDPIISRRHSNTGKFVTAVHLVLCHLCRHQATTAYLGALIGSFLHIRYAAHLLATLLSWKHYLDLQDKAQTFADTGAVACAW